MLGSIISLLAGIPAIANGLFAWLNKKTDADLAKYQAGVTGDTAINVEEIRTRVGLAQAGNETRKENNEHWFTAWMIPTAFLFFMGHAASVVVYSTLWCKKCAYPQAWEIAALPPMYADMQSKVILTICGVAGIGAVLKKVFSK